MKATRTITRYAILAAASLWVASSTALFAAESFVKYEGIDGESKDENHGTWVDVSKVTWGIRAPASSTSGARQPLVADLVIHSVFDKSAPKIAEKAFKGAVIPKVELEVEDVFGGLTATFLRLELKNVQVVGYEMEIGGDETTVKVSVRFEEIKMTYTEYDSEGKNEGNVETEFKLEA